MKLHLVTGVAGFIGSSIARALVARGDQVRGIDNFSTGKTDNLVGLERIELIEDDLNSPGTVDRACRHVCCISMKLRSLRCRDLFRSPLPATRLT